MKRTSAACVYVVSLLASAAMGQDDAPAPKAPPEIKKPAQPKVAAPAATKAKLVPIQDPWLIPAMRAQLQAAVDADAYDALAAKLEDILLARLRCGKIEKHETLAEMVFLARAARFLDAYRDAAGDEAPAKTMPRKALAAWLFKHEPFARVLFRAMGGMKNPDEALKLLAQLVASLRKRRSWNIPT